MSNEKHTQYRRLVRVLRPGPAARPVTAVRAAGTRVLRPWLPGGDATPDKPRGFSGQRRRRMTHRLIPALIGLLATCAVQATTAAPGLAVDSDIATAGFFRLYWESAAGPFELQEASDPDFHTATTLYHGPDLAAVISGKPDGTWHYRVRTAPDSRHGPWSNPVTVTVSHHDLSRAILFLLLGLLVFIAITLMIIRGEETR